jgi:hypothetical protein
MHDEFIITYYEEKEVPFPMPFICPPNVELIKLKGSNFIKLEICETTPHKFVVKNSRKDKFPYSSNHTKLFATYRWIVTGTLLAEAKNKQN